MKRKNNVFISIALLVLLSFTIILSACSAVDTGINIANVTEIDILILESFPVQVHVVAKGYLPNPCTRIDQIIQSREGNNFFITIKTKTSSLPCIQVLTPFKEIISLDVYGLPAGTYTVNVNGIEKSFTLDIDNILPETTQQPE
jgi:inhibitor of cysteine peptidase